MCAVLWLTIRQYREFFLFPHYIPLNLFSKFNENDKLLSECGICPSYIRRIMARSSHTPDTAGTGNDGRQIILHLRICLLILVVICFITVFLSGASVNEFDDFSVILKSGFFIYCCVCLVGSWVVSGILMPFVSANIDEVVSRCMRYRNSKVDLFEFKWKYMIALFLDISRAVFGNVVILGFVISQL